MFTLLRAQLSQPRNRFHGLGLIAAIILGIVARQIPFSVFLGGQSVSFTLFDFVAPVFGAVFGLWVGLASVLLINLGQLIVTNDFALAALIRLVPVLFAVWYFARRPRIGAAVGMVAIALWIAHPIGREVWYYSLFWTIPVIARIISRDNVFTSALGATFTQHAVGGVAWLYAFGLSASVWQSLVPVVAIERALMAIGISAAYVGLNALVRVLARRMHWDEVMQPQPVSVLDLPRQ